MEAPQSLDCRCMHVLWCWASRCGACARAGLATRFGERRRDETRRDEERRGEPTGVAHRGAERSAIRIGSTACAADPRSYDRSGSIRSTSIRSFAGSFLSFPPPRQAYHRKKQSKAVVPRATAGVERARAYVLRNRVPTCRGEPSRAGPSWRGEVPPRSKRETRGGQHGACLLCPPLLSTKTVHFFAFHFNSIQFNPRRYLLPIYLIITRTILRTDFALKPLSRF